MGMQKYDIFVSYRRTSFETANLIATKLQMAGYSVFFDVETLRSGKFNEQLFEVIEQCKDIILVLPPDALDRCSDEGDWVRLEVEHAMKHKKNIVPIMLRGFEWPPIDSMPESLRELPHYNAITASDPNVFVENIERLKHSFLISRPNRKVWRIALFALIFVAIAVVLILTMGRDGETESVTSDVEKTSEEVVSDKSLTSEEVMICDECAGQLMNLYMLSDINMQLLDQTYNSWERLFVRAEVTNSNIEQFKSDVTMNELQLHYLPQLIILDSDYDVLADLGISVKDIEDYESSVKEYNAVMCDHFGTLKQISSTPKRYYEYIEISKKYYLTMLEYNYCILLEIFSKMPESIYDTIYDTIVCLEYFTDMSMRDKAEEYQRRQKQLKNNIETMHRKMLGMVE